MAWTFRLSRHEGQTTLVLEDISMPWMVFEEVVATTLLPHSLTYRLANKMLLAAGQRHRRITEIPLDPAVEAEIDLAWANIWSDDTEEYADR